MLKIILLGWVAGIAVMGRDLPFINNTWWIWLILATLICGFEFYKRASLIHTPIYKTVSISFAVWALFCTGYHFADSALVHRLSFKELQAQPFDAVVYVKQIDELSNDGQKQVVEVLNRHSEAVNWLLYLKRNKDQPDQESELKLGQYYRIYGEIKPAHSYAVPGAFDQEKWFLQQNVMSAFSVQHIQPLKSDEIYSLGYQQHLKEQQSFRATFLLKVAQTRLAFRQMLQASNLQHKGLLLALLTGDESLLSNDLKQQFQQLGISHLLAISGPHVLIFALMLTWLLQKIVQRYVPKLYLWQPKPILLILPFCLSVLLYVAFVGFEIPAVRTLLTVLIGSLFLLLRRQIRPLALLIYSASFLLLFDPFSILSAAFWLSYGACFILIRLYQTIEKLPKHEVLALKQKGFFITKAFVESQWKIFIALLPLVLIFFQQVSWFAPLSNLIAIPLLSMVVVPFNIFAACIWLIIPPLGKLLFQLNDFILSIFMTILNGLHRLSPELYGVSITPAMMIIFIIGLIILFLPRGTCPKFWAGVCFLPLFLGTKSEITELNILDVGQGQSIVLQLPKHTLMIDTGGSYDETKFSLGERVVIPFLRQQGIRHLDRVILSHLDQDHSGAFPSIQKAFDIDQVQSNERGDKLPFKDNFSLCHQGQSWSYPNVKIDILMPREGELIYAKDQQNEYSCIVYVQFLNAQPYQNFLIMGDAGWEAEFKLLQQYPNLKVDVLVLGHHGSKHSSAYDFLATLKPKLAIASTGFNNRYGHPSQETKNRLEALDIPFLDTAKTGTLSFVFADGKVELKQNRQQFKWLRTE